MTQNDSIKSKTTYPGGKGSVLAVPGCCLTGSADAVGVEEDSLGFAASAAMLFRALGWAQSGAAAGSSPADTTGNAEVWLSEELAASVADWGSAVSWVQSAEDTGASTEPVGASETEELSASGAEADDSPLTEKWEITFVYQNLMGFTFQITNFQSKWLERNIFKLHLYVTGSSAV